MTENELREKVAAAALAWQGVRENTAKHRELLEIYNAQSPLPRGTRMQASWPWCAAFVSAVSLQCGLRDILPTECSCPIMITLYRQLGRWVEDDGYVPHPGDVLFYDWDDSGIGDNIGTADHVGIVTACDGVYIDIIEGNSDNAVKPRRIAVNARFIRGYGVPDYASKADGAEPEPPPPDKDAEPTPADPFITQIARQVIGGTWGNGQARRDALGRWFADAVQNEVNKILGA